MGQPPPCLNNNNQTIVLAGEDQGEKAPEGWAVSEIDTEGDAAWNRNGEEATDALPRVTTLLMVIASIATVRSCIHATGFPGPDLPGRGSTYIEVTTDKTQHATEAYTTPLEEA
ncbi:hypothetical protein NDU88_000365 [Pleurodeles waltl]|uniref:Uncharacterized protein n=1 Tax=Pleurodeles waltl TaxID=8319 RepID=A0AAV7VXW9_PLEWA|nr:hypothetical protein NDU88_000365 [Pleurodeles waltl]